MDLLHLEQWQVALLGRVWASSLQTLQQPLCITMSFSIMNSVSVALCGHAFE